VPYSEKSQLCGTLWHKDHGVLPAVQSCASTNEMCYTCLYSQTQRVTALWLVLISRPTEVGGWVGLGWLHTEVVCSFLSTSQVRHRK